MTTVEFESSPIEYGLDSESKVSDDVTATTDRLSRKNYISKWMDG